MSTRLSLALYAGYTFVILAVLVALPGMAKSSNIDFFREGGFLELVHVALPAACGVLAWMAASRRPAWGAVLRLLALVALLACIRELDGPLRGSLPVLGWRWPAAIVLATIAFAAWRWRVRLAGELAGFVRSDAFGLLWAGFVVTALLAQLVGHGEFLELILSENYDYYYKRVVEEVTETGGYLLILFGVVQTVARAPRTG